MLNTFSKNLEQFMTMDQVRTACPAAFKQEPTNPNVSNQYVHVNTQTIMDDLRTLGWHPVSAQQRTNRKPNTIFSKHMITFQNPDIIIRGEKKLAEGVTDDAYPRIIMMNSHDGLNAFSFSVGIFRLVCSNGLVIADEKFSSFKIRHKGYSFEELRKTVQEAVEILPQKVEVLNRMKKRILTEKEKEQLALDGLLIRAGITPGSKEAAKYEYDEDTIVDLLDPIREEDKGEDLWTVFNIVQEKVIKGGFFAALKGGKVRKVRKIKSFEKDLEINKDLFKLATSLLESE